MRTLKAVASMVMVSALGFALAACGSSSSSSSSTTSSTSSTPTTALNQQVAVTEITSVWTVFFDGKNPNISQRDASLQNLSKYGPTFQKAFTTPTAKQNPTSAKVDSITFPSSSECQATVQTSVCAKVTYDLVSATSGQSLLTGQTGYAVYENGKWLVSSNTFCALAQLEQVSCPS